MKINRLLDPLPVTGGGTTAPAAAPATTPVVAPAAETPKPLNPGTAAKAARDERLARDIFEEPTETAETTKPVVPVVAGAAPVVPATQNAPIQLSQEQLAQIVAARNAQPAPVQQTQQRPLTQQEIDQQLGVVNVTAEMCAELGLPESAMPFLNKLVKGIVTNAVRMSNVIVDQKTGELRQMVAPHISFAQQQQHLLLEHQFNEQFPDLKGYDPIIKDVAAKLKASGFKGSQKEAFDRIATDTRTYLTSMGITPGATNSGGGSAAVTTQKPTMSTVSKGSQGGAGGAPKTSKGESWQDVGKNSIDNQ